MNRFKTVQELLLQQYNDENIKLLEHSSYFLKHQVQDALNAFFQTRRFIFKDSFYKDRISSFSFERMENTFNKICHFQEIDIDNIVYLSFIAGWGYFEKRNIDIINHLDEALDFGELGKYSRLSIVKMPNGNNWLRYSLCDGETYWQGW